MPLYIKPPVYECEWMGDAPLNPGEVCVAKNICDGDPRIASWSIDWLNPSSMFNWQQKLDMMCEPKLKIGLLGTMYFIGWTMTATWLPRFADLYGRKNLFKISQVCDTILFVALFMIDNINAMLAFMFILGLLTSIRINVGYIYMTEFIPKRGQSHFGTAWCAIDASVMLWVTLYFINSITRNWEMIVMVGFTMQIIGLVGSFMLPESPKFLIE